MSWVLLAFVIIPALCFLTSIAFSALVWKVIGNALSTMEWTDDEEVGLGILDTAEEA